CELRLAARGSGSRHKGEVILVRVATGQDGRAKRNVAPEVNRRRTAARIGQLEDFQIIPACCRAAWGEIAEQLFHLLSVVLGLASGDLVYLDINRGTARREVAIDIVLFGRCWEVTGVVI